MKRSILIIVIILLLILPSLTLSTENKEIVNNIILQTNNRYIPDFLIEISPDNPTPLSPINVTVTFYEEYEIDGLYFFVEEVNANTGTSYTAMNISMSQNNNLHYVCSFTLHHQNATYFKYYLIFSTPSGWIKSGEYNQILYDTQKYVYVDDDGTADYTSIQDAIDNASDGDRIYVFEGIYNENINIDKSITLLGENAHNTIIDGNQKASTINLSSEYTTIKRFSIIGGGFDTDNFNHFFRAGIRVTGSHNIISDNIFRKNRLGISGVRVTNLTINDNQFEEDGISFTAYENDGRPDLKMKYFLHTIEDNFINEKPVHYYKNENNRIIKDSEIGQLLLVNCTNFTINDISISNTDFGIILAFCNNCILEQNKIDNNSIAIWIQESNDNIFQKNKILNNYDRGMVIDYNSNHNLIKHNQIEASFCGVQIEWWSNANSIIKNNLENNNVSGNEHQSLFSNWNLNYYDDWIGFDKPYLFFYPKIIYGMPIEKFLWLVMPVSFEFHPAKEPYQMNHDCS